jgi:hypothetical protein
VALASVLVLGCQLVYPDATFDQMKALSRRDFEPLSPSASPTPKIAAADALVTLAGHHVDLGRVITAERILLHDPGQGDRSAWLVGIRRATQDCPRFDSTWGHVQYDGAIVDDQTGEELADFGLGCPPPGASAGASG